MLIPTDQLCAARCYAADAELDGLEKYSADELRIRSVIGNEIPEYVLTPENISRDRLMRTRAGLYHLLTEIIPHLENVAERQEVYLWVSGIYDIVRCEGCDIRRQQGATA